MSMLLSLLSLPTTLNLTPHTPLHLNPLQQHLTCQHRFQALPVTLQLRAEKQGLQALVSLQLGGWQWSLTGRGQEVGGWQLKLKKEEASVGCLEMPLLERLKEDEGGEEEGRIVEPVVEDATLEGETTTLVEQKNNKIEKLADKPSSQDLELAQLCLIDSNEIKELNLNFALNSLEVSENLTLKTLEVDKVLQEKRLEDVSEDQITYLKYKQYEYLSGFWNNPQDNIFHIDEINRIFSDEEQFEMHFFNKEAADIVKRWRTPILSLVGLESNEIFKLIFFKKSAVNFLIKQPKKKPWSMADCVVDGLTRSFKEGFSEKEQDNEKEPLSSKKENRTFFSLFILYNFPSFRTFLMHDQLMHCEKLNNHISLEEFFNSLWFKEVVKNSFDRTSADFESMIQDNTYLLNDVLANLFESKNLKPRFKEFFNLQKKEQIISSLDSLPENSKQKSIHLINFCFEHKKVVKDYFNQAIFNEALKKRPSPISIRDQRTLEICSSFTNMLDSSITHEEKNKLKSLKEKSKEMKAIQDQILNDGHPSIYLEGLQAFSNFLDTLASDLEEENLLEFNKKIKNNLKFQLDKIESQNLKLCQEKDHKETVDFLEFLMIWADKFYSGVKEQGNWLRGEIDKLKEIQQKTRNFQDEVNEKIRKTCETYLQRLQAEIRTQDLKDFLEAFEVQTTKALAGKFIKLEDRQALSECQVALDARLEKLNLIKPMLYVIKRLAASDEASAKRQSRNLLALKQGSISEAFNETQSPIASSSGLSPESNPHPFGALATPPAYNRQDGLGLEDEFNGLRNLDLSPRFSEGLSDLTTGLSPELTGRPLSSDQVIKPPKYYNVFQETYLDEDGSPIPYNEANFMGSSSSSGSHHYQESTFSSRAKSRDAQDQSI